MSARISAMGRAGRDGETVTTRTGTPMASVSLAVDVERGKDDGDKPAPMWVKVVAFGDLAEVVANIRKGTLVSFIGRFQRESWTGRDGAERQGYQCVADAVLVPQPLPERPPAEDAGDPSRSDSRNA